MRRTRHAKIVATLGPASNTPEMIGALEKEVGRPIGILQDLQGPKIRIGTLKEGKIEVKAGERLKFVLSKEEGSRERIPLPHPEIFAAVNPGHELLIDDGRGRVLSPDDTEMDVGVVNGGTLSNRKGVNLLGTALDSMVTSPVPTRAEASDVSTAIYDGACRKPVQRSRLQNADSTPLFNPQFGVHCLSSQKYSQGNAWQAIQVF